MVFDVYYCGKSKNQQGEKLGMKAETTINRFDYTINFDVTVAVVGKDINIIVHLQFAKQ